MSLFHSPRRRAARSFARGPIAPEMLESRTLMAVTPVLIGGGAAKSVRFTDVTGTQVSVFLSGPGSAMVNVDGTNVGQSATPQGVLVSGTGLTLSSIGVTGTTLSSSLDINTRGRTPVGSGPITVDGFLGTLRAPNVNLTGNLTTSSYAHQIQLGGASNGTINIGPSRFGGGAVIFQIGAATNESFVSALKVNLLKASAWTSTTGATQSIQAPQVQVLQVKGSFSPDLALLGAPRGVPELTRFMAGSIDGGTWNIGGDSGTIQAGSATGWDPTFNGLVNSITMTHDLSGSINAGTIKSLSIRGSMSNTELQLTDPLTANGFDMNNLSVASNIVNSTIRSIGSIGSISAMSLQNTRVYAGIVNLPNGQNLPASANDIPISAQIRSLHLRKSATATFVNSDVAAAMLGSLNLGTVRTANAGTPFGFAARQPITSLQLTDEATGKSASGHQVASTAAFNGLLAAKGIPQQDVVGEVF